MIPRIVLWLVVLGGSTAWAQEPAGSRLAENQRYFELANQPTGMLIPLYHYPAHIHKNAVFNRLIELKKTYPTVPVCAIVNPSNGPGTGELDQNYVKAIDRLHGAGVVLLGYVSTRYGKQPKQQVLEDIQAWQKRYPKVHGLFLDEMANQTDDATVNYYVTVTSAGHEQGFWPVFANPGTATPEPFFAKQAADVFVIHEGKNWPAEVDLKGDYFGGYADYPPFTRSILVHSQAKFDREQFAIARKHVRWIYVTHDLFDAQGDLNDQNNNPWDALSEHLEQTFQELSR